MSEYKSDKQMQEAHFRESGCTPKVDNELKEKADKYDKMKEILDNVYPMKKRSIFNELKEIVKDV